MSDDRGFDVDGFHRPSPDRVVDLVRDLNELALREVSGGVFGVAFVLEHLQDDFVPAGSCVDVFVAVVRASRHGRDDFGFDTNSTRRFLPGLVRHLLR